LLHGGAHRLQTVSFSGEHGVDANDAESHIVHASHDVPGPV
jgi:hypothetical protein